MQLAENELARSSSSQGALLGTKAAALTVGWERNSSAGYSEQHIVSAVGLVERHPSHQQMEGHEKWEPGDDHIHTKAALLKVKHRF